MKATKIAISMLLIVALAACVSFSILKGDSTRIAFIELTKVYNSFQMKKELEGKMKTVQQMRNNILDSLKLELQVLSRKIETAKTSDDKTLVMFNMKRENY